MSTNWETADILKAPLEIVWQFSYEIDNEKLKNLYSKSKRLQWDAETYIDWSLEVDPSKPLLDEERFALAQLPFIERLSQSQQEAFRAHYAAYQLSQFLHGEQGALMTAASLTHAVPDYEGKLYAATQTMDEARHVEVYDRYIKKLAMVYPMASGLKMLIDQTLTADSWVKTAIGMNMVVEGLALGAFHNMRRATGCALLRQVIEAVLRDEARHVAFGNLYVQQAIRDMHEDDREAVGEFTFNLVKALYGNRGRSEERGEARVPTDMGFVQVLQNVGIEPMDFAKGIFEHKQSGKKIKAPPGQVHTFRDLMMPALVRVGAVTERCRERLVGEGIPIWEDRTVLERFEQDHDQAAS